MLKRLQADGAAANTTTAAQNTASQLTVTQPAAPQEKNLVAKKHKKKTHVELAQCCKNMSSLAAS